MDLLLLRHAIAVERGTPGYEHDSDRPLTKKGIQKMYRVAEGMLALDFSFDVVLSSPFARAKHTAEIVVEVFKARKKLEFTSLLATDGDPAKLVDLVNERYADKNSVMLVGHEPYLGRLASVLVTGRDDLGIVLKKGGLCKLSMSRLSYDRCANLEWFLTPSQMRRFAVH
jgi:phosphohistidine phosphatase